FCGSCDPLLCIDGNDDQSGEFDPACDTTGIGSNRGSTVSWCSIAGQEYLVYVGGFGTASGMFELIVSDDGVPCAGPVPCDP
ncbi:MAG: hypothetical protein ACYTGC_10265, partial [Planctomycetota bacterium]